MAKGRGTKRSEVAENGTAHGAKKPPDTGLAHIRDWLDLHHTKLVFVLLACALVWRLVYYAQTTAHIDVEGLTIDEKYHHDMAVKIAEGQWVQPHVFFRAPFYYYVLGTLYSLTGPSHSAAIFAQILLSCGTCYLLYRLGRALFDGTAALFALAIAAFYGAFSYFAAELLFETLLAFLCVAAWLALLKAEQDTRLRRVAWAGLLLGLCVITRPNLLVFTGIAGIWMARSLRSKMSWPEVGKRALVLFGMCALPIAATTAHNYAADQDWVWVASQGGVNLYIGNNPEADGVSAVVPEIERNREKIGKHAPYEDYNVFAKAALANPDAKASEIDRYWTSRAISFIREDPAGFVERLGRKLYYFWNAHEIGNERAVAVLAGQSSLYTYLTLGFWFVCPLAGAGVWLAFRERKRISLLLLFVVTHCASTLPFFVNARFRLPIVPALIVFAAYVLARLLAPIEAPETPTTARRWRVYAFAITVVLALVIQPYRRLEAAELSAGYFMEGMRLERLGESMRAIDSFERSKDKADELHDRYAVLSRLSLGRIHTDRVRDFGKAERNFQEAAALDPQNPTAYNDLGVMYLRFGQHPQAQAALERALELRPDNPFALGNLASSYRVTGQTDRARARYARQLELEPQACESAGELAKLHLSAGAPDQARQVVRRALDVRPDCAELMRRAGL